MKNHLKYIALFLFLAFIGGSAFSDGGVILAPGDIVRISVFQNPDLATEARISEEGTINFPLVGEVKIGGMDERGGEIVIEELLQQGEFVKSPQVTIIAERYTGNRQASVLGEVKNPGKYPLIEGNTIIDMIALAGGITSEGSDQVILTRFGDKGMRHKIDMNSVLQDGELREEWVLQPKDVVFVPKMEVFYIYGEVQKPGVYPLDKNLTVIQAVSVGGSVTERGTLRGINVQRLTDDGGTENVEVQLSDRVMPGDVITVEESLF